MKFNDIFVIEECIADIAHVMYMSVVFSYSYLFLWYVL
jgi:hypothetical protein